MQFNTSPYSPKDKIKNFNYLNFGSKAHFCGLSLLLASATVWKCQFFYGWHNISLNSIMVHLINELEFCLGFLGSTCLDSFEHSSSLMYKLIVLVFHCVAFEFLNPIQLNLLLYCEHKWPTNSWIRIQISDLSHFFQSRQCFPVSSNLSKWLI